MATELEVIQFARRLSYDIIDYAAEKKMRIPLRSFDYYVKNMRLAVDYLLERFHSEFQNLAIKFSGLPSICESFSRCADKLFDDKVYNWWRIFTLYACTACLADMCASTLDHQ